MTAIDPTFTVPPGEDPSNVNYTAYAHSFACDLSNDVEDVLKYDPASAYEYSVQFADQDGKFENGAVMEAKAGMLRLVASPPICRAKKK